MFVPSAERLVVNYLYLEHEFGKGNTKRALLQRYQDVAVRAKHLRQAVESLTGIQALTLTGGLSDRFGSLDLIGDGALVRLLTSLVDAADDSAAKLARADPPLSPGGCFVSWLAAQWTHPNPPSAAKKSVFYRAVKIICEHSEIPIKDPTRWIAEFKALQNEKNPRES